MRPHVYIKKVLCIYSQANISPDLQRPLLRTLCIISDYRNAYQDNALSVSILVFLSKGTMKKVDRQDSLRFCSRLFLVPKPENNCRPIIDTSSLNCFLNLPKFKLKKPESIGSPLVKEKGHCNRPHGRLPTPFYLSIVKEVFHKKRVSYKGVSY